MRLWIVVSLRLRVVVTLRRVACVRVRRIVGVRRSVVVAIAASGWRATRAVTHHRPLHSRIRRVPTVVAGVAVRVVPGGAFVLRLGGGRCRVLLVRVGVFLRRRPMIDAARATAVGHVIVVHNGVALNDGAVVVDAITTPSGPAPTCITALL